jgi:ubiquinone/menaquinone biosynthesis C-methylase UbiE
MIIDKNKLENKTLIELIQPQNKNILEIGCGDGTIAKLLSPLCQKYIGIDVDKDAINKANKNNSEKNLVFFVRSGEDTEIPNNSIDTVLMHFCLHEVPPQKQGLVLKEVHRILKNKGQLLIIDPSEPVGEVQSLYNIAYKNFLFFNHSTVVKHAQKVIKQILSKNLYKTKKISNLKIEYFFDDLQELQNFIQSDFNEVNWNSENKKILVDGLLKITKNKTENITLIDDLTVTNLIKM